MPRVKICGITNLADARVAAEAGADFLGFIFYPKSPRYVTPAQVAEIVAGLDRDGLQFVGVFVDEPQDAVVQVVARCGLDVAQLHGQEPPEAVGALAAQGVPVIKAFRVRDGLSRRALARYRPTAYLLDTYVPGRAGGTGRTFDWSLATVAQRCGPVVLAGGLHPGNVAEAVRTVAPWAVDVSSGVEVAPGRKDPEKVRAFVRNARAC